MDENWTQLQAECAACTQCALCGGRHHVVFGVGNPASRVMLIGEGPGENEDLQGEPFVGKAGQLLDKYLAAIDLSRRENVYIANIVKCRPPHNRDPLPEEQNACIGWLRRQVALVHPQIIVCLGRIAAMRLMDPNIRITQQHGQWIQRNGVWMMATLHPAALLRNPAQKPDAFCDFLGLREKIKELDETGSP